MSPETKLQYVPLYALVSLLGLVIGRWFYFWKHSILGRYAGVEGLSFWRGLFRGLSIVSLAAGRVETAYDTNQRVSYPFSLFIGTGTVVVTVS